MVIEDQSAILNNDDETSDDRAEPGDNVKLYVELKNAFSANEDIEINDITVTATILGIDEDDEDLEEESEEFDLEADKSKTPVVTFKLPLEVEEKTYDVEVRAEGESQEESHEDFWTVHFKLDKKAHDIIITKGNLSDETVNCGDSAVLSIEMLNIGSNYEDDAALEAKNPDLGLNFKQYNIDLGNDPWEDDTRYNTKINVNVPSSTKSGTYPIVIKAFYDTDALDDFKTANLAVECMEQTEEEEQKPEEAVNKTTEVKKPAEAKETKGNQTEEAIEETEEITSSTESNLITNPKYFALLVIGNIAVIGLIIFFLIKVFLFKKKAL